MAVTQLLQETIEYGDPMSAEQLWRVTEAAEFVDAKVALYAVLPDKIFVDVDQILYIPLARSRLKRLNATEWAATVTYQAPTAQTDTDGNDPADYVAEFDTSGGTQHITHAPLTGAFAPENTPVPLVHDGINLDREGRPRGLDIGVGKLTWAEEHEKPAGWLTLAKLRMLSEMTWKTNSQPFRGFPAREVLCTKVSGSRRGTGPQLLRFAFTAEPHRTDQTIGEITGIEKRGHDVLWVMMQEDVDESTGSKIVSSRPRAVYTHEVYPPVDFANFEIGP